MSVFRPMLFLETFKGINVTLLQVAIYHTCSSRQFISVSTSQRQGSVKHKITVFILHNGKLLMQFCGRGRLSSVPVVFLVQNSIVVWNLIPVGQKKKNTIQIHCLKRFKDQWFCGLNNRNFCSTFMWQQIMEQHVFVHPKTNKGSWGDAIDGGARGETKRKCWHSCDHIMNIVQNVQKRSND